MKKESVSFWMNSDPAGDSGENSTAAQESGTVRSEKAADRASGRVYGSYGTCV